MTPSRYGSKKYPNLYRLPSSKNWVFRKYSKKKGKEFKFSTGESKSEALAHEIGQREYLKWLGLKDSEINRPLFEAFVEEMVARKLALPDADYSKNSKRSFQNSIAHLKQAFGHLHLDQVAEDEWESYYSAGLATDPSQKFFNRRKILIEVMRKAQRDGFIKRLPDYRNPDPETDTGQYLKDEIVERILDQASPTTELLIYILWKQGARPGEVLQYRWDMIRFDEGEHGSIHIPGMLSVPGEKETRRITKTKRSRTIPLNSEVAYLLRCRKSTSQSDWVFPSPNDPGKPMVEFKTGWKSACRRMACLQTCKGSKLAAIRKGQPGPKRCIGLCRQVKHPTIYDLRRTFISNQARKGSPIVYVAKYVDSSVTMIERFYAKSNLDLFGGLVE
jgi:integrase